MIYTIKQEAGCNKRESTPASFPPVNINEIKSFFHMKSRPSSFVSQNNETAAMLVHLPLP